ncbi:hypothetical protein [Epilithonimonas xixisoli]|uniref:Uncharacterized protein n=1 Tax=Epilithonimonas xixisoli TaxID=1476462 RepID=A0A4R8ICR9_9FLAO|nr:hypothetical protein [Epilithonimonas xixisoli]TDX86186.1 hypothetical protein B0I22_0296 [Epilithonimonas xixisoli]
MNKSVGIAGMAVAMALGASTGLATNRVADFSQSLIKAETTLSEGKTPNPDAKLTNQFADQEKVTFKRTKSSVRKFVSNYGIDPKTYGMYHVKAGTHKRTNV